MQIVKSSNKIASRNNHELEDSVSDIINRVKTNGDATIKSLSKQFDGVDLENIKISKKDIEKAYSLVDKETIEHLNFAASQIDYYARNQLETVKPMEINSKVEGIKLGHRLIPVNSCGAYIPGGRYPLPSSALMSVITAKVAGVKNVYACCPPAREYGNIHPAVLVALDIAGADEIYCVGGAQAIAALTYGTETVSNVNLIVGPGNKFVTEAKRQVLGHVGIDSLAGPSEVLIIADESANPVYVASDLLAQCEHDPMAKAILVTTSNWLINQVEVQIKKLAKELTTGEIAYQAWKNNGEIIFVDNMNEAINVSDEIAPEHLEIQTKDYEKVGEELSNYGSLFLGSYSPVAFGDYVSGTNHILPTMGTPKYSNGVWIGTFLKTSFFQKITKEGCQNLASSCMHLAEVEGLFAHKKSVEVRIK